MRALRATDSIAHYASSTPDKLALIELPSGRRRTYSEASERIDRLAGYLAGLGIKPGDRVGFLAQNSTDIIDIVYASWRVGAVVLALNFRLTASELEYILEDAGPTVLFVDYAFADLASELQNKTSTSQWIYLDGQGNDSPFEQAISRNQPVTHHHNGEVQDLCMLMYSSGTTGKPKGVMITHGMLQYSFAAGVSPGKSSRESVSLAAMPLFHIAAMNVSCLPTLAIGATTIIMRTFDPGDALNAINDPHLGVTHFFAVPAAFNAMRLHENAQTTDFSRLVTVLSGAETVPPPLVKWWGERNVCLQEGYGLTETAGQGCLLSHEDVSQHTGSAGRSLIHSEMKIMADKQTPAEPGQPGEIWIRGNVVTPGYWNRPEATDEAFVGDWFRTGDIGKRDKDGFFFIEDRLKDMYISGGENIYPAEIEGVLYGFEPVREVSIIGVPHETWGEAGCAIVALKEGATMDLESLLKFCDGKLATYKHPLHLVLVDVLPRNATGKVLKYQLRQQYASLGSKAQF